MNCIKEITIKYFRSVYNIKLKDLGHCVIFSGQNDAGKSNVLKALNLFFNNQTDWQTDFNFRNDFSFKRLQEVREETIKGKQFIQVEIKFRRGDGFQNTLPREFSVKKTWDRNSQLPKESNDLEQKQKQGKIHSSNLKIIQRSLTQYLNKVKFEYVPAIKDKRLFEHMMNQLQDEILIQLTKKGEEISEEIARISSKYSESATALKHEFQNSTGINTGIALPISPNDLFRVLNIVTDFDDPGNTRLNLDFRGDGIRLRYIPSLYNFLAENYRGRYILGFEEPENSMEYGLGSKMAHVFFDKYAQNSQIFITSHSPSFLISMNKNVDYFRIYQEDSSTKAASLRLQGSLLSLEDKDQDNAKLREELGLTELQREFHKVYEKKLKEAETNIQLIEKLNKEIDQFQKPVVYTEGKTDVTILNCAWDKLYPGIDKPFEILSVETTEEEGGDGGYGALNRKIESVRPNEKLQIGLYDRDYAGFKRGFQKLNKNLVPDPTHDFIKKHKNSKAYALVLPPQQGLENFTRHINLPIEFLFRLEDLKKKDKKGMGLKLIPFQQKIKFGDEVIDVVKKTDIHLSRIDPDTKKLFAERIVPTLEAGSFQNFKLIFHHIRKIVDAHE